MLTGTMRTMVALRLTFPLQKQPEQGAGRGDGLLVVVIVVDGQQVTVHVGVAHQQLHIRDVMDVLKKAVKLIEAPRFGPVEREATKLCPKLGQVQRNEGGKKRDSNTGSLIQPQLPICLWR